MLGVEKFACDAGQVCCREPTPTLPTILSPILTVLDMVVTCRVFGEFDELSMDTE